MKAKSKTLMQVPELNRGQSVWVMLALGILFFFNNGDTSMLSAAAPQILSQLDGTHLYALVFSIKMLTNTVSVMLCGKLSDRFGRRNMILVGTGFVLVGYIASALSGSMLHLVIARAITGIGSGLSLGIAYTMLGDLFKGEAHAKAYMGYMIALGIAMIGGPLLGGIVVSIAPWPWVFWSLIPITVAAFIILLVAIPNYKIDSSDGRFDTVGAVLFTTACTCLLAVLSGAGTYFSIADIRVLLVLTVSLILFVCFFKHESSVKDELAIMPASLLKRRSYSILFVGQLCLTLNTLCLQTYVPLFIQSILGASATESGMSVSLINLCSTFGGLVIMRQIGKSQKYNLWCKLTTSAEAIAVVLVAVFLKPQIGLLPLYILMCLYGISASAESSIFIMTAQEDLPPEKMAVGTSGLTFVQGSAALIGTAVGGAIINLSKTMADGINHVFIFASVITVVAALILCLFMPKDTIQK